MTWQTDGVPRLVWSRDADAAVAAVAPAAGSKIDFVFEGKLDGARIEDTVGGNPVPKANPPITVGWPDMDTVMSTPAFAVDVFYNSLPTYGQGTTTAFVQTHAAGFPSATTVTFLLDPNGLTSVYGEPMVGPTEITVTTEPLVVTLPFSNATVSTSYRAPIAFSTRGPTTAALKAFVQVTTGGAALPFELDARYGGLEAPARRADGLPVARRACGSTSASLPARPTRSAGRSPPPSRPAS